MDGLAAVEGFLTPVFAFDWIRQDDQTISVVLRDRRRSAKRKRDSVQPQEKTAEAHQPLHFDYLTGATRKRKSLDIVKRI